ncbi:MAG: hypothetical protein ACTHU0_12965 [Kofleriaceae bacterium]
MRFASLVLLVATGCRGLLGIDDPVILDGETPDAPDASVCTAWMPHGFAPCDLPPPLGSLVLGGGRYTFITHKGELKGPDGTVIPVATHRIGPAMAEISVMVVDRFTLEQGAELRATGTLPLIIAAYDRIEIAGTLDAGSRRGAPGAGANNCDLPSNGGEGGGASSSGGSGGGGGAGFHGAGGTGGIGQNGATAGGAGAPLTSPPLFRGGCQGGKSGRAGTGATSPSNESTFAEGGNGGGAIHLASRVEIAISGAVLAGGSGGNGAPAGSACGGGGGGSGGYIGIDAPRVEVRGVLAANGGGGGGSARFTEMGTHGSDGLASELPVPGGTTGLLCSGFGGGGAGAAGQVLGGGAGASAGMGCGGGGAGGGAGYILVWSADFNKVEPVISPPEILNAP